MTFKDAVLAVEGHLLKYAPAGLSPKVYTYNELDKRRKSHKRPWAGVLVAEVSFFNEQCGCSYMQVDFPYGMAVCAQTERAILAFIEEWPKDELDEELSRLSFCLTSK